MTKTKKAVQKLLPLKFVHACIERNRRDPELPDHVVILPLCSICGKAITDFDAACLFTRLTRTNRRWRTIDAIGQEQFPLLRNPDALYAGHNACCQRSEVLIISMCKKLSSVLKPDQRDKRDLALGEIVF